MAGEQPVVAVLTVEEVAAPAAGQGVVAGPADEAVGLPGSRERVVARATIGGDEQGRQGRRHRELVVQTPLSFRLHRGGSRDLPRQP